MATVAGVVLLWRDMYSPMREIVKLGGRPSTSGDSLSGLISEHTMSPFRDSPLLRRLEGGSGKASRRIAASGLPAAIQFWTIVTPGFSYLIVRPQLRGVIK